MSEQSPVALKEIIQFSLLSQDETRTLAGISYERLPDSFSLSPVVYNACRQVWTTFAEAKISERYLATRKRAIDYYLPKAQAGDHDAIQHMAYLSEEPRMEIEFGQQFYRFGNDIAVGSIHRGSTKRILLRDNLDGLPDSDSIVNIHSHPNELTFSDGDVIGMFADVPSVPEKCLYLVVERNNIHLMFPTNETPRTDVDSLRTDMQSFIGDPYERVILPEAERYQAEFELMRSVAERYQLGYYTSPNIATLSRVQ